MEGDYINYVPGDDGDRKMLIDSLDDGIREPEVIRRKDIPKFLNNDNLSIISQYDKCTRYGLPYTGNKWALEPCVAMDIIYALDRESSLIRRNRSKNGNG